jgi:FkbM family methyltransferase
MTHYFAPLFHRLGLKLLRRFGSGDIKIRHHYTQKPFRLDRFKHRGYWFYGKRREHATLLGCREVIANGDTVIEIGGHIGYLATYFAQLVSTAGRVIVFEPGENNLPYLIENCSHFSKVSIERSAVTDYDGDAELYLEDLTGQNNSLISNYKLTRAHLDSFGEAGVAVYSREVKCTTLDLYCSRNSIANIAFVKIDVEGAEVNVVRGMQNVMTTDRPAMMVECSENAEEIFTLFKSQNYQMFTENGKEIESPAAARWNVFAFHVSDPRAEKFLRFHNVSATK